MPHYTHNSMCNNSQASLQERVDQLRRHRQDAIERVRHAKQGLTAAETDVKSYEEAIKLILGRQLLVENTSDLIVERLLTLDVTRVALNKLEADEMGVLRAAFRGIIEGALECAVKKEAA